MPSDTDWAWTAGMLDGDGCISCNFSPRLHLASPTVSVINADRCIIDALMEMHGGSITTMKKYFENHRQTWTWRINGAIKIRVFLTDAYPYMRNSMKRERARMVIEEYPLITKKNGKYTPEEMAAKHEWQDRFMALGNGRGSRVRRDALLAKAAA